MDTVDCYLDGLSRLFRPHYNMAREISVYASLVTFLINHDFTLS